MIHTRVLFFIHTILLLLMTLMMSSVQAQVYQCENSIGEIRFSDEICQKGETTRRLNWLNSHTIPIKQEKNNVVRATRKMNEAYARLSLLTNTQVELKIASLRSSYQGELTKTPELILPDGVIVDLQHVNKIIVSPQYAKKKLKVRFIMTNGYEEVKLLKSPYPIIKGMTQIGRFSKSLQDIKKIEFFHSKQSWNNTVEKYTPPVNNNVQNSPIIELDLSGQLAESPKSVPSQKKSIETPVSTHIGFPIQIKLVNKKILYLQKTGLSSSKGQQKSHDKHFIINDTIQIPFKTIKQIKIRPMTTNSALLVAIELVNKEIKMEVMLRPYTRIMGKSHAGLFEQSLFDIQSINIQ